MTNDHFIETAEIEFEELLNDAAELQDDLEFACMDRELPAQVIGLTETLCGVLTMLPEAKRNASTIEVIYVLASTIREL
jgi:hypothetical protein